MKLGDRIKRYEAVSHYTATARMPLMIRVDGRAFHTFTSGLRKPYDQKVMDTMVLAAWRTAQEMQGFKAAYIQSDEATFCITDYDRIESQGWFDYDISKVVSISAALMSAHFNDIWNDKSRGLAVFDSRAFSVPVSDVINAFLWRAKDWERNSLQMFARAYFSHKELQGKKRADIHEMLHSIGKNWATDTTAQQRNGTFLIYKGEDGIKPEYGIAPTYASIEWAFLDMFEYPE